MSLIKCPECNNSVSDSSYRCLHCGLQLRKPIRGFFGVIFKYTFIIVNILMALVLFFGIKLFENTHSAAEGFGALIGNSLILGVWGLLDLILGILVLLTRPKE